MVEFKVGIGIDPGLCHVGYACLSVDEVGNGRVLMSGSINPDTDEEIGERLFFIGTNLYKKLSEMRLILKDKNLRLTSIGIEKTVVNSNAASSIKLAEARGVALVAIAQAFPLFKVSEISPTSVKKTLCNDGKADKNGVNCAVRNIFSNIDDDARHDEIDAIAIAYSTLLNSKLDHPRPLKRKRFVSFGEVFSI